MATLSLCDVCGKKVYGLIDICRCDWRDGKDGARLKPATPQPPTWKQTVESAMIDMVNKIDADVLGADRFVATPEPPAMGELVAKELRQCEENGVSDNALIRTSDGGWWRYWADSKSWHSVQAPPAEWVALQARIDAAVARRKAKREDPPAVEPRVFRLPVPEDRRNRALRCGEITLSGFCLDRAMSTPLPHDPDIHTRLMPWKGKEDGQ